MSSSIASEAPKILAMVFDCTLDMIKADFTSYPDHRVNFYDLLAAINAQCFESLFALPPQQLRLYVDSLVALLYSAIRILSFYPHSELERKHNEGFMRHA